MAVVTGTRAEYGLLCSTMEAARKHRKLDLQVVVTGMHLLRKFGYTVRDIESDGWRIDARIKMQTGEDDPLDQAGGLSHGVAGIAEFLDRAKTDIVVVLGDRIEAMAGALAAVTTGRFLAHIHGGDLAPGDVDDSLRHAVTKLAHLHFPATKSARRRILRLGESPDRVHWVGAPGLDRLRTLIKQAHKPAKRTDGALIVQHPSGRSAEREYRVMRNILRTVEEAGLERTIIYPNSDRGHQGVIAAIEEHRKRFTSGDVRIVRSLDRDAYLRTLLNAKVLVGNSSGGIIESATAGTPAVNVGSRQQGRERSGRSVIDADESLGSIRSALATALKKRPITGGRSVYGDGGAGARIAQHLAAMPLDDAFRRKINAF